VSEIEADAELLDRLAEEFLERLRRGDRPLVSEYAARHPGRAADLRRLLSALALVEDLKPEGQKTADPGGGRIPPAGGPVPERLGDFRILREIGRGGMGIVYEAEQQSLNRRVALKVLAAQVAHTPQQVQRFLREARAAAQLHHTNIVPVFGIGEYNGLHYYAMQFINGLGLDKVLDEVRRLKQDGAPVDSENRSTSGPGATTNHATVVAHSLFSEAVAQPVLDADLDSSSLSSPSIVQPGPSSLPITSDADRHYGRGVIRIGLQVAEALEYAHQHGTLHRDIKPSNILLDGRGTAWVTDFGLAKAAEDEDLTRTGDLVGTLRYMAPERFRGQADARSDVYALGLTLYELLTLRPAFDAMNRDHLVFQVMHSEPPRLRRLDPALPRDLETIVHKAIEKDPEDRYPSAGMMAEDLRCLLEDQPIGARRIGTTERVARWARRNPWLAVLGLAVVVLLAVIALGATVAAFHLQQKHKEAMTYLGQALEARAETRSQLWESLVAQSRASRRRIDAGRRSEALAAVKKARDLDNDPDRRRALRDEAVAALALTDLTLGRQWEIETGVEWTGLDFDSQFARYARGVVGGDISLRDARDDRELARLPSAGRQPAILRFSPDGRLLAVKYDDEKTGREELWVWDLEQRRPIIQVANGVTGNALDFRPDSRVLAAGRRDGSIRFLDLGTGREVGRQELGRPLEAVRFDPSGRRLAVSHALIGTSEAPGPSVEIVPVGERAKPIVYSLPQGVYEVEWQSDGRVLAAGGANGNIYLLDPEQQQPWRVLAGHYAAVVTLAFHPEANLLASRSWDGTLRLWDVDAGEELVRTPLPGSSDVHFSRDGRFLGPCLDGTSFWFWDVALSTVCRRVVTPGGLPTGTWRISFHPQADLLASAGSDGVRLVAPRRGQVLEFLNLPGTKDGFFDVDGRSLITSGEDGLLSWPLSESSGDAAGIRLGPAEPLGPVRGLPTGRVSSVRGGTLMAIVIDRELGQVVIADRSKPDWSVKIQGHRRLERVALSPDGRWLATGTWQGTEVKIWDVPTGALVRTLSVQGSADVTFSPEGRWGISASGQEYRFWEAGTWRPGLAITRENAFGMPGKVVFSPNGRLAALTRTRDLVELVDPVSGLRVARLELPDSRGVTSLGFSPDGDLLAMAYNTASIRIWNLKDLRQRLAALELDWDEPPSPPTHEQRETATSPGLLEIERPAWLVAMQEAGKLASQGRYAQAVEAYGTVIAADAATPAIRFRQALVSLAMGRVEDYRRACQAMIERFGEEVPPRMANLMAWTLVLGPDTMPDPQVALRLARRGVAAWPDSIRLNTLGGALFRAGQGSEAVRVLLQAVEEQGGGGTPFDWVLLALASAQQGQPEEARRWLDRVRAWEASPSRHLVRDDASWSQKLQLQVLRAEAETCLSRGER
jgi:serine/threonine protein kinase/WD40 repeat protein